MKRLFFSAIAACTIYCADAQLAMPQPSPLQHLRQDFGLGKIEVTYSRPSLKGRSLFAAESDLAPLGKLWRTGANAATRIRFSDQVTIGGNKLDSGTYSIFTIPQANEWEVIFNKNVSASVNEYNQGEDAVRVKVPAQKMNHKVETFTINLDNITSESVNLQMMWGNTLVNVPVKTNIKDRLRAQLESALQGDKKPYFQAANFYYEYDKNFTRALESVNQAIQGNEKAFWIYMLKARIQKDMGDKAGAKATAQQVIKIATDAKNDDYVRMANDMLKKM